MGKKNKPLTKKRRIVKIVGNVLTGVFAALIVFGCFVLITSKISASKTKREGAPTSIGNRYLPIIVVTNSMEPDYKVNTAIFVQKESCEKIKEDFDNGYTVDLTFYDGYSLPYSILNEETQTVLAAKNKSNFPTANLKTTMTHRLIHVQVNPGIEYGKGKYLFFVEGINRENALTGAENQYQVFSENEIYGVCKGHNNFVGAFYKFVSSSWGLIILLLIPSLYMIISSILDLVKKENNDGEDDNSPLSGLSNKDKERLKDELLSEMLNKEVK